MRYLSEPDHALLKDLIATVRRLRSGGGGGSLARLFTSQKPQSRRYIRNSTGETIPAFAVCRPTGATMDGTTPVITVAKPSTTFSVDYVVNGSTAIAAGEIGDAQNGPLVYVLYDDASTPSSGEGWGPKPDQWSLSKHYPISAVVKGTLDAAKFGVNTTAKVVLAQWQQISTGIGKANATIANRASGAISIWAGTFGSEVDITGMDISSAFNLGPSVASGDWVSWSVINGQLAFVKLCS